MKPESIGILGGTFNPIHNGHLSAAAYAKSQLGLSKVLLIPAGIPPHKELPKGSPSASQRLKMLQIAAEDMTFLEVSDIEINREGKSYTFDTVCELRERYQNSDFFLILGTDMFLSFDTWHRAEELAHIVKLAVVCRQEHELEQITKKAEEYRKNYGADITFIHSPVVEISSTKLREVLRIGNGDKWIPPGVMKYIRENKLYV